MKQKARILVVEDDAAIAELLLVNLKHAGFYAVWVEDGDQAQRELDKVLPNLIILDWMLPGRSGMMLAKHWRNDHRTEQVPIIMLTARHEELDRVSGLDAGADDYLIKPFSIKELLARVRALLRRKAPEALDMAVSCGNLILHPDILTIEYNNNSCKLGRTEANLLKYLMHHKDKVHSRDRLLDKVWGDHVFIEDRTVDVQIKRLRQSLRTINAESLIETIRGVGYRLNSAAVSEPIDA